MTTVLFVCLGNICRSPAAEGVLRHLAQESNCDDKLYLESCGIGAWHIGALPDARMRAAAQVRGVILTSRAQQFQLAYLDAFDYILASDQKVLEYLFQHAQTIEQKAKLHLMTAFSDTYRDLDIPDPYYQGNGSFELVLDMLEDACRGLLRKICK